METGTILDILDNARKDILDVYEENSDQLEGALTALYKVKCAVEYRANDVVNEGHWFTLHRVG